MRKILFIDRCIDCMYFNRELNLCRHSESKSHSDFNAETIPDWCPLEKAPQQDADMCQCKWELRCETCGKFIKKPITA